jgi:AraC family transcriptional regulator
VTSAQAITSTRRGCAAAPAGPIVLNGRELAASARGSRDDHERAIRTAVHYAERNLGRPLTVSDMAEAAMYSRYHFTRIFRQLTAMSPGEFLTELRIAEAKRLLSETDLTVADVCRRVGYRSLGTFTARFATLVGLSPGRFRQGTVMRQADRRGHRRAARRDTPVTSGVSRPGS